MPLPPNKDCGERVLVDWKFLLLPMKPIAVFRAGTHTDKDGVKRTYTQEQVDRIAEVYDPRKLTAKIVVGHPEKNEPAYGDLIAAFTNGNWLNVLPRNVEKEFESHVNAGKYNGWSIGLLPPGHKDNPVSDSHYLYQLGAVPPDMQPGVEGVQIGFTQGPEGIIYFHTPMKTNDSNTNSTQAEKPPTQQSTTTQTEDFATRQRDLDQREKALKDREAELKKQEVEAFCNGLVKDGRLLPVDKDNLVAYLCAEPSQVIAFTKGKETVQLKGEEWLRDWLSRLPQQFSTKRLNLGDAPAGDEDDDLAKAQKAAAAAYANASKGEN